MMHRVVHTDRPTYKVDDICKENLDHKNHSCILNIMRQKYYRQTNRSSETWSIFL